MNRKPIRYFLIYCAEQTLQACGTTLTKALKSSGIDEQETPVIAVIESHCVASSALQIDAPTIAALVIRNPNYRKDSAQ